MSLAARAAARGVAMSYADWAGRPREVPEETVERVLDAMGEPYEGEPPVEYAEPGRCPLPPRTWGWTAQLYAVRSRCSWGIGDLGDLARLARWSGAELGAGFVLVNPLHAVAPGFPQEPSPYFPASRRFANPVYLAVEELPEVGLLDPEARAEVLALGAEARGLNAAPLVDRDAVWRAKSRALELLFAVDAPLRRRALAEHRERDPAIDDFALWAALAERYQGPYQEWPEQYRHPSSPAVGRARESLADRVTFHAWLQWLCAEQLAEAQRCAREAGMPVGLVHDLAVGCHPGGADAWLQQDVLAPGVTVGAPPDSFNPHGQDWRLPPWRPDALRASGFAPFRDLVRATVAYAGGIRVDHAMGLWRLFWIPEGMSPEDGTYVRYDAAAMLGILAEECRAAGAIAVAEDLGTVEPGVPETLREHGVLSSAVLWFEEGPPAWYPEIAFASVTTHDLPTARGFWADPARAVEQARVLALLRAEGLVGDAPDDEELVVAMHAFIARAPSLLAAVALGDALGDPRQPNLPGSRDDEYPSWRIPLDLDLDDLGRHPLLDRVVRAVRAERGRERGPAPPVL